MRSRKGLLFVLFWISTEGVVQNVIASRGGTAESRVDESGGAHRRLRR